MHRYNNHFSRILGFFILMLLLSVNEVSAQNNSLNYWNSKTHLMPLRLPLPPLDYKVEYLDLNGDKKPDAIKSVTHNNIPILWLDDDGNMKYDDIEGSMVNDCLLIDRNKDGIYGGQGDLIIDWVDLDDDGKADMQIVIEYPNKRTDEVWPNGHYMITLDLDHDNVFNYIDWNTFDLRCWEKSGISDFYQDYSGKSAFMKIHTSTYHMSDLRFNWENPFLFYDPDGDGLTEMAIRMLDSPPIKDKNASSNSYVNRQLDGVINWASLAVDLDNDNTTGNEFDFDFSISFSGHGLDYKDQVHRMKNLRGLPEADKFFMDPRYRQLTELIYPDHKSAPELIFNRGEWSQVNFVYDEDDDCGRWERVELYDPKDPYIIGGNKGGVDNNKQSDVAGDRGEWDLDNSGKGRLYLSHFDGRLHLYGAEKGVWRIDQNAQYYQGWDRMWQGNREPQSCGTVLYNDRNSNGFFDYIQYDLNGDTKPEFTVDLIAEGVDDTCKIIDISNFTYKDYTDLGERMTTNIWHGAEQAIKVARQYGLQLSWYAKWMQATTLRDRYNKGYWLQFYIYKDLENLFMRQHDDKRLKQLCQAYYSGDWSKMDSKTDSGFYMFSKEDISTIRASAKSSWGKAIIADLDKKVAQRRNHSLIVPTVEGGHFHHYFCPKHNLQFKFDWDKPLAHYCSACDKDWTGVNRYDWAWIYEVHALNKDYIYQCMYLYLATTDVKYANYIRSMVLDYAGKYDKWEEHDANRKMTFKHSGKAFAQSLDESNWFTKVAMAYTVIKPILTKDEIAIIENGCLKPGAKLLLNRPSGGNWQMWHNSGLAALGVALEDDSIINVAIYKNKLGYNYSVKTLKNSDGWINEGSPHYHYYPLEALLFTANAVRCRGINLFNSDLLDMFVEPIKGVYPDLSFPAHGDGWYGANLLSQSALYETANARFGNPLINSVLSLTYSKKKRLDPEALMSKVHIKPLNKPLIQSSFSFDASGFALLRNEEHTVVLKFGGEGIGHGHPDKLSITIHNGKQEIISDFGTSGYGIPDYLQWYKRSLSHNTVTVDAKDQQRSKGKLLSFVPGKNGGSAVAEANNTYKGVKMQRSLDLKGSELFDQFTCTSDSSHMYEYVILFNEKPIIEGTPTPVVLNSSKVHKRIINATSYVYAPNFKCKVSTGIVSVNVSQGNVVDVVVGEAPGIPSNPTVKDGPGAGDNAVRPCYPLIIRVKGKVMNIQSHWEIRN